MATTTTSEHNTDTIRTVLLLLPFTSVDLSIFLSLPGLLLSVVVMEITVGVFLGVVSVSLEEVGGVSDDFVDNSVWLGVVPVLCSFVDWISAVEFAVVPFLVVTSACVVGGRVSFDVAVSAVNNFVEVFFVVICFTVAGFVVNGSVHFSVARYERASKLVK